MARKSKNQQAFEDIRGELLGKYSGEGVSGGNGFVSSGNEAFDTIRKDLLTRYATDHRKPVQNAPDYRRQKQEPTQSAKSALGAYEDYARGYAFGGPFASQKAMEAYYSKQQAGSKSSLPLPGTQLPKGEPTAQKEQSFGDKLWERLMESMGTPQIVGTTTSPYELTTDTSYKEPSKDWTQEERDVYEALKLGDQEKADRFAIDTNNSYNKEKSTQEREQAQEWGKEHKALAWLGNTFSGIASMGMGDFLNNGMELALRGEVTEKEHATPRQLAESASAGASQGLNEKYGTLNERIPVIGGKGLGEVYQLTQSIAQSMALANATGRVGKAGAYMTDAVFFGNSAASAFDDAKQRGATDDQAYLFGALNGLNEALGEHLSIENLITMNNPHTLAELGKNILKQAGIEGSEEAFTTFLNSWAEQFVMKDKSSFYELVNEYTAQGMNENDAKKKAWISLANDMAFDFVGGAFTGGISGGMQSGYNYITSNTYASQYYRGSQQELVQEALDIDQNNQIAKKAQGYIDQGKDVPGNLLSQLIEMNDSAILRDTVKTRLEELGETGDVESLTDAIIARASEEGASGKQRKALKNSQFGQQVAQEVKEGSIWRSSAEEQSGENEPMASPTETIQRENKPATQQVEQVAENEAGNPTDFQEATQEYGNPAIAVEQAYSTGSGQDGSVENTVSKDGSAQTANELRVKTGGDYQNNDSGQSYLVDNREPVNIAKVAAIENGNMTLELDTGETVEAKNVSFGTYGEARIYQAIGNMGVDAQTANQILSMRKNSGLNETGFASAIQEAYRLGQRGVEFEKIRKASPAAYLNEAQRRLVWTLGRESTRAATEQREARLDKGSHKTATAGVTMDQSVNDMKSFSRQQKATMDLAKALGNAGFSIELYASTEEQRAKGMENGSFNPEDGRIRVDINAGMDGQGLGAYALAHEVTHFAREFSPGKYQTFLDTLIQAVGETDSSYESMLDQKIDELLRTGEYRSLSEEQLADIAQDEVVAEMCETMFTDTDAAQRLSHSLYAKDKTLWGKFKELISGLVDKLREAYKGLRPDSAIARQMKDAVTQSEQVLNAWVRAVSDAVENYQRQDGQKKNAQEGVRFSLREYDAAAKAFSDEISEWDESGRDGSSRFILGSTGEVLQGLGAIESDIYMNGSKINTILQEHPEITLREIKRIPEILNDPVLVLKSRNVGRGKAQNTRMTIFGTVKGQNGLPVMTVFDLRPSENHFVIDDMQKVTSAYTKTNGATFFVSNSSVLYVDKKRTTSLLRTIGFQMPIELLQSGYIGNISYNKQNVNIYGEKFSDVVDIQPAHFEAQKEESTSDRLPSHTGGLDTVVDSSETRVTQDKGEVKGNVRYSSRNQMESEAFKRWFGDWQNDPENASKVVNKDGTPKVLYHQTSADFTIFETRHEGAGTRDQDTPFGIFMKSSNRNIGVKGEKQMALYAKIVNPLTVTDRADLMYQLKKISPEYEKASTELQSLNDAYQQKYDDATKAWGDYVREWRKAHPDAGRTEIYDDPGFSEIDQAEDNILEEWEQEARKVELRSKEAITRDLEKQGYDGIIIQTDKGSFGRSTDAYIALHPEQVKSATDNAGTFDKSNPDIRYSNRTEDVQKRQIERQQEEIGRLKELVNIQKYGNKDFTLDQASVKQQALDLMKAAGATGNSGELSAILNDFYRNIGTSEELSWEGVSKDTQKAVDWLMEHKQQERDPYSQEILDWMKGRHVALSEDQVNEAAYLYGSLREFRKAVKGTVVLDQTANTSLDQFWQEAASQYGDRFDTDTNAGDMPGALAEIVDALRNSESVDSREAGYYEQEIRQDLTRQVYDSYWEVKPVGSVRDEMQKKMDLLKAEHARAMEDARQALKDERACGKQAIEDYRKQRDVVEATMMAAYSQQRDQVERAYAQEMEDLRKTYGKDTATYQEEFFTAMKNSDFQDAKSPSLRKMLNELAHDNSLGNKDAEAARKQVYDNLRQQYEQEKDIRKLEAKVQQQREAAHKKVESRKRTDLRQKIYKKADTFRRMALTPGKGDTLHAPVALMGALADFCDVFYQSEARAAAEQSQALGKRGQAALEIADQAKQERELGIVQRKQDLLNRRTEAINALRDAYGKLKEDRTLSIFHDDHVQELVDHLEETLRKSDISGMSADQLEEVYDTMKAMEYTIVNANKVFSAGKNKTLIGMTNKLTKEIKAANVKHSPLLNGMRKYWMWQMRPDTYFNYLCGYAKGNEGKAVQEMFVKGSERMMGVQREFYQLFRPLTEAEDAKTRKAVKELMSNPMKDMVYWGLKDANGNEVKTSKGMALQAYLLLCQEDSFQSILHGGFKLPRAAEYYKGNIGDAYGNADSGSLLSQAIGESYQGLVHDIQEAQAPLRDLERQIKELKAEPDSFYKREQLAGLEDRRQAAQRTVNSLQTQAENMTAGATVELIGIRDRLAGIIKADPVLAQMVDTGARWYKRSGELLAEVYENMYGYRPNLVDGYTPIHRDLTNVKTDVREDSGGKAANLENMGLTKERVPSYAPIRLTDFFQELSNHTQEISRFYGFAQAQKDFNRIWNLKMPGSRTTVNSLVADKYGAGKTTFGVSGEEYINNYIKSVAGSSGGGSVLDNFYGAAAAATLSFNPRVAFSQAASIPTAAGEVGWGSMARGFAKGLKTALTSDGRTQLANDSIWFWQRYRGAGGSTEFSDLKYQGNLWARVSGSKAGKALFNWCQAFDVFSTASMWAMAEDAVQHQQGLKPGAQGYQAAVEQKYADIIRKTQPNYTVTERSDLLRDKRDGMKLLTMYKTQSNQNLNILMESWGEYKAVVDGLKAGDSAYTQADKKTAGRRLANGVTSVTIGGTLAFVLLRTAVNLVMGNLKYYRDDDTDEVTKEGILKGMLGEVFSSAAGMFALGGQLEEILYSAITGDRYYGISDSAIGVIANLAEDGQKVLATVFDREMEPEEQKEYLKKYGKNLFFSAMTACGVPAKNIRTMLEAVGTWYTAATKGIPAAMESGDTTKTQYQARILRGWRENDMGKISDTLATLTAMSDEDTDEKVRKEVTSGVATYLKKQYRKGKVDSEEAKKLLKYIGHEDPEGIVDKWIFQAAHPDSKLSDAGIAIWNRNQNIPLEVFEPAYKYKGECKKKDETVKYIQKLGISSAMKWKLWDAIKGNWTDRDVSF